jgi:hypothetical protein
MAATLLLVEFPMTGFGPARTEALRPLAEDIAGEPGLIWKIWTEAPAEGRAGGVYLFESRAIAEAYLAKHSKRLAARGVTGIEASFRGVDETLSRIDRAPLG